LSARAALKMRCENYFFSLYDDKAFQAFRISVETDLVRVQRDIADTIQQNGKLKSEHQISTEILKLKEETLQNYLQDKNNLKLVIQCIENDYIPDDYFPFNYGFGGVLSFTSKCPQLKALKSLIDCFALSDNKSTKIAIQINNFHQVFLKEKENFKFDTEGQKFLEAIGHILATVLTIGIYAIAQMSYSHYKKNSLMFWKSEPELIQNELDNALKEATFNKKTEFLN
jgi:hypothetical protein